MRSRLGDDIDDYCVKCKRVMNHLVVSLLNDEPAKVRCRTCHGDHDFRHEQAPPPKIDARKAALIQQALAKAAAASVNGTAVDGVAVDGVVVDGVVVDRVVVDRVVDPEVVPALAVAAAAAPLDVAEVVAAPLPSPSRATARKNAKSK